ncbi:MAG: hypothetical protein ACRDB0_05115 [Paraclostridium sp.]
MKIKQTPKDVLYDLRFCDSCGGVSPDTLLGFRHCGIALCNKCLLELESMINIHKNTMEEIIYEEM